MTFLSFFILLIKKYLIIKYFFIINVPINYPPLSKKCAKLSKNCTFTSKKFRKIQKNSEKSDFFTFLLMVSSLFLSKVDRSFNVIKMRKNVSKKS